MVWLHSDLIKGKANKVLMKEHGNYDCFRFVHMIYKAKKTFHMSEEWYKSFNHVSMDEFLKMSQRFKRFGLTPKEVEEAIKSACEFFSYTDAAYDSGSDECSEWSDDVHELASRFI